ncbi:hypothetical protein PILCRDRAFT_814516 [Piloderma croceum F 1598]|uniref:Uncharacterized protein n=1 Tax=Piloderma croceum (strain F 1598) TaxID=765440 RepID=A0A0C3BMU2_PILCF|nr:hypothetical protein PILCRDRAFT_814516 [Piloderma croceum F 1598]
MRRELNIKQFLRLFRKGGPARIMTWKVSLLLYSLHGLGRRLLSEIYSLRSVCISLPREPSFEKPRLLAVPQIAEKMSGLP